MLINDNRAPDTPARVEFVSYTGEYPNLCRGILILRIDGEEVRFNDWDRKTYLPKEGTYPQFWSTRGECYFSGNHSAPIIATGAWAIDVSKLPEHLRPFAEEIDAVFNDNVERGCCGGCL